MHRSRSIKLSTENAVSTYGEEDLVNNIKIDTAKKMNMKRLENSMWSLLTESPEKPSDVFVYGTETTLGQHQRSVTGCTLNGNIRLIFP
ncbi:hypothetical protein JOB18_040857 [Solea senegalensis]|uniref:Uncharacterized protein n=1 Tax=Solea senegalensis TaxID=28829 RepID=A0AAV6P961_SOLSE|nr:hypothetical protein JOB18_040857 [Solea senegalensis]